MSLLLPSSPKPESSNLSPGRAQRLQDEHGEDGLGQDAFTPPSVNSSFVSGSLSDRTTETRLDSRSPPPLQKEALSSLPASLIDPATEAISLLWHLRDDAAGQRIFEDDKFSVDPFRYEVPLNHIAYHLVSRLLSLEEFTDIINPICPDEQSTAEVSGESHNLQNTASSIFWALEHKYGLHADHNGNRLLELVILGRWTSANLRLEYDYDDAVFIIRMPSVFHDQGSCDTANKILENVQAAVGGDLGRFSAKSLPFSAQAGVLKGGQAQELTEETDQEQGEAVGAGPAAPKKSQFQFDSGIFDEKHGPTLKPGLILEFGWAHPTQRKRAKSRYQVCTLPCT